MVLFEYYRRTARELQRYESVSRSPYLNVLQETINNIEALRAYGHESVMRSRFVILFGWAAIGFIVWGLKIRNMGSMG